MDEYSKLWEAWIGGFGDTKEFDPSKSYGDRAKDFYSDVVADAFGYEGDDLGEKIESYIPGFDIGDFERAERDFRMAIGDPYEYENDPFSWERVSRMSTDQAQAQLEDQLYGKGSFLGGAEGSEYKQSIAENKETYTSGLQAQSKALANQSLSEGQGVLSGTSGTVLRSGGALQQSEDILAEAYKAAKGLGEGFIEDEKATEADLEFGLDTALTKYLAAIDKEKSDWESAIGKSILMAKGTLGEEIDLNAMESESWGQDYATGLTDQEMEGDWEFASEPCGIGMIRNSAGDCVVDETLGLQYDNFGRLCPSGDIDDCGVCDGDGSSCTSEAEVVVTETTDDVYCESGVYNADGTCNEDVDYQEFDEPGDDCVCQYSVNTGVKSGETMAVGTWASVPGKVCGKEGQSCYQITPNVDEGRAK